MASFVIGMEGGWEEEEEEEKEEETEAAAKATARGKEGAADIDLISQQVVEGQGRKMS